MKFIRFLLFPFSIMYAIVTTIRNFLFDVKFFKSTSFKKPVIAVGNLSVGGTGKTPQIEYLIQLLKEKYKVAVLSRGYGRKTKGFIKADTTKKSQDIGDEPLQYYTKFKEITVAVDEDRVHGIQQLNKAEVVLLDDAYQHRKVKAGFYVLLTKFDDLFSNDFVLPTGNLRERRVGAKRADVVVVTKCPDGLEAFQMETTKKLLRRYFDGPIFFSKISYAAEVKNSSNTIATAKLNAYEMVLVTGIANPKPLLKYLNGLGVDYSHINFPDHHQFSEKDIRSIQDRFDSLSSKNKIILTTEKDFVRLSEKVNDLYYLPIASAFIKDQEKFDASIENYVHAAL